MLQPIAPARPHWQRELKTATRTISHLLSAVGLQPSDVNISEEAAKQFRVMAPETYIRRIQPNTVDDPLLKQILPTEEETEETPGYLLDPVGDNAARKEEGVIHKYQGRALLITTGACAIHCRYCFRKHFPYGQDNAARANWQQAVDYLKQNSSIHEVILSGGDPLMVPDTKLVELIHQLEKIPHITTLRIHTRLSIVLPSRINIQLLNWIGKTRLRIVLVTHCNHPNELNAETAHAHNDLRLHNVTLLNQAVLLRGINDHPETLCQLSHQLFEQDIMPYYLHQLDHVQGAAHFDVSDDEAKTLMAQIHGQLPGYLVPRLVREIPGETGKTPIHYDL